jgi:predicted Zn-dependent protease with MMP-like domain
MEIEPPDSLYGLYQGTPLTERSSAWGNNLPDIITLFQKPIEEDCEDEDEVRAVIGETLIHEVGHYFGLSEEEIEEIEERYWRGETLGPEEED